MSSSSSGQFLMPWVHENQRSGTNQGYLIEILPTVPFPGHTYQADVSPHLVSVKIQKSGTALGEMQPDPYERLTICLWEKVWQNFFIFVLFFCFPFSFPGFFFF